MAICLLVAAAISCSGDRTVPPPGVSEIEFRVIGEDLREGEPYSVAIVGDSDDFAELSTGADRGSAAIDFEREVVLVFDLPESSSCPYEGIEKLGHDAATNIVYPVVPTEGGDTCTGDALPHRIILAVPRASLPERDFQLWINSSGGAPEGVTIPLVDAETMALKEPTD